MLLGSFDTLSFNNMLCQQSYLNWSSAYIFGRGPKLTAVHILSIVYKNIDGYEYWIN